jgi:hypothetical protein
MKVTWPGGNYRPMLKGSHILAVLEAADADREGINRDLLAEGHRL